MSKMKDYWSYEEEMEREYQQSLHEKRMQNRYLYEKFAWEFEIGAIWKAIIEVYDEDEGDTRQEVSLILTHVDKDNGKVWFIQSISGRDITRYSSMGFDEIDYFKHQGFKRVL